MIYIDCSAQATLDEHSVLIHGERRMTFAGEFHLFGLPSLGFWVDVLQRVEALRCTAVPFVAIWIICWIPVTAMKDSGLECLWLLSCYDHTVARLTSKGYAIRGKNRVNFIKFQSHKTSE